MHLFQAMDVFQQSSDKMLWLFHAQLAESSVILKQQT